MTVITNCEKMLKLLFHEYVRLSVLIKEFEITFKGRGYIELFFFYKISLPKTSLS